MDAIMKSWDNALLSEEHTYRAAHRIVLHTHIISTEFAQNTWINFAQGLGIIARRSPNICDYTGTDFINMLLSSPGSQISESLFKARTASLKARKGEHIHKRRLLFGCCFFNTLFGAAESNPGLFTLSVLAPGRSGARANQIRSAWNNSSPASPTQVISCHFQLNPGEDNLRWGSSQKTKILSALSVENPKPRSLSSFKDKVKKMKITFKLYLLI